MVEKAARFKRAVITQNDDKFLAGRQASNDIATPSIRWRQAPAHGLVRTKQHFKPTVPCLLCCD